MLYKRGQTYYTRFTAQGLRVNKSCRTTSRTKAQHFEARLKSAIWDQAHLGLAPARTWPEAVDSWLSVKQHKRSLDDDLRKLIWLEPFFSERTLDEITPDLVARTLARRQVSNATQNRYRALILSILRRAHSLGWLAAAPEIERLPEPTKTPRFLTQDQAAALLDALDAPRRRHLRDMVAFSLATGLRERNVTGLRWDQVDLAGRAVFIQAQDAKGQKTLRIPLNTAAHETLKRLEGRHPTHVFSYRGRPVRKANRDGFQAAKSEAGLPWLRWHDLRHTWASWHAMAGTPLRVLQELGGWSDLAMVMRYAHLAGDFADAYAENVAQNVTHPKEDENENAVSD